MEFARHSPGFDDDLPVVDSTPVECGRSIETMRRSALADAADYGYCASHSRFFWGFRLHGLFATDGTPRALALTSPKTGEREVCLDMLARVARTGRLTVAGDKGYAGREFEDKAAQLDTLIVRPRRKDEPGRGPHLAPIRQCIESIFQTCKDMLGLERHGARELHTLRARLAAKFPALTALSGRTMVVVLLTWEHDASGAGLASRGIVIQLSEGVERLRPLAFGVIRAIRSRRWAISDRHRPPTSWPPGPERPALAADDGVRRLSHSPTPSSRTPPTEAPRASPWYATQAAPRAGRARTLPGGSVLTNPRAGARDRGGERIAGNRSKARQPPISRHARISIAGDEAGRRSRSALTLAGTSSWTDRGGSLSTQREMSMWPAIVSRRPPADSQSSEPRRPATLRLRGKNHRCRSKTASNTRARRSRPV
jgi:Transposase DDE domain